METAVGTLAQAPDSGVIVLTHDLQQFSSAAHHRHRGKAPSAGSFPFRNYVVDGGLMCYGFVVDID
jgi:hypothetical protein